MSSFLKQSDSGSTIIIEHSIPIPKYDVKDKVIFLDEDHIENYAEVMGYSVEMMSIDNSTAYQIAYTLDTGDYILEEEIIGVYNG